MTPAEIFSRAVRARWHGSECRFCKHFSLDKKKNCPKSPLPDQGWCAFRENRFEAKESIYAGV